MKEKKKYAPPEIISEEMLDVKVVACQKCPDGEPTGGNIVCDPSIYNT